MADHSVQISFDLPGERQLESYFDHLVHIPDDWRPAWEHMAEDFWASEEREFDTEGQRTWAPLSPRYAKWKERHYPGMPMLVRTGALKLSLTQPDAKGAVYDVFPTELQLGTDLKTRNGQYTLGMLHQTGTRRGMPPRPPVKIRSDLQSKWNERLTNWLREELDYKGG